MVTADTANVLTTSWGTCEPEMDPSGQAAESSIFAEAAARGRPSWPIGRLRIDRLLSPLFSDADVGGDGGRPGGPARDHRGGGHVAPRCRSDETVWNNGYGATGGGVSSDFTQPSWQAGRGWTPRTTWPSAACSPVQLPGGPDVAASADPAHGDIIYYGGAWIVYGGTSAASPVWAA